MARPSPGKNDDGPLSRARFDRFTPIPLAALFCASCPAMLVIETVTRASYADAPRPRTLYPCAGGTLAPTASGSLRGSWIPACAGVTEEARNGGRRFTLTSRCAGNLSQWERGSGTSHVGGGIGVILRRASMRGRGRVCMRIRHRYGAPDLYTGESTGYAEIRPDRSRSRHHGRKPGHRPGHRVDVGRAWRGYRRRRSRARTRRRWNGAHPPPDRTCRAGDRSDGPQSPRHPGRRSRP